MESADGSRCPASQNLARRQYDWNGKDNTGTQAPGKITVRAPDSFRGEMPNSPPTPGLALADNQGAYAGTALWIANGVGDYNDQVFNYDGAWAVYNRGWIVTPQGKSQTLVMDMQMYTPDHTEDIGEPRSGWHDYGQTSRYISVGFRVADGATHSRDIGQSTLWVKIEPACRSF